MTALLAVPTFPPDQRSEDTWRELEMRSALCGQNWCLSLGSVLRPRRSAPKRHLLLHYFCCALSLGESIDQTGRTLFEYCVADVAEAISRTASIRIGFPRGADMPVPLNEAVALYCGRSRELLHANPMPATDKDLGLDVVTWLGFSDGRGGYLHFLGQCATGADWKEKLVDLSLPKWRDHMNWAVEPVRFVALPRVVSGQELRRVSLQGGLVIDRPRILELATRRPLSLKRTRQVQDYCSQLYA
jgi:hypothetical protein